ncbi:MAG: hypothetical protein NDJ92_01765 [Thermoanaerobaculia bacterium]|nr:hypothetical protein [Thermoanaerobaculia bacterium]
MDELKAPEAGQGSSPEQPAELTAAEEETPLALPRWVAPAIGLALVAIAAMAVWTGFRPRTRPEARLVITEPAVSRSTGMPEDSGGAPGNPEPGASRMVQSESGGAVPDAQPLPEGELPRITIEGNQAGVTQTSSVEVRRGIAFDADRPDAIVYVNDLPIGDAGQYSAKDQAYEFAQEGTFNVRVVAKDGTEARFVVVATAAAQTDVLMIRVRLARI